MNKIAYFAATDGNEQLHFEVEALKYLNKV